jgi:hypothetical protein
LRLVSNGLRGEYAFAAKFSSYPYYGSGVAENLYSDGLYFTVRLVSNLEMEVYEYANLFLFELEFQ